YVGTANHCHFGTAFAESVRANIPKNVLNKNGWLPILNAKKLKKSEDVVYGKLNDIAIAVQTAATEADPAFRATNFLLGTGQKAMTSEVQSFIFKPDLRVLPIKSRVSVFTRGEIAPRDPTPVVRSPRKSPRFQANQVPEDEHDFVKDTSATAAIAEVKKHYSDANMIDDDCKLIGGATEIMYYDPRRRFIFGFTIEGNRFRLWNFNRGHEPLFLIRFLIFLISATPTQLGYDPTIKRRQVIPSSDPIMPSDSKQPKKVVAYEYSVGNTSYLTEGGPISEISAYHINSRATRVWLVREIIPNSTPLAVKDEYRVLKDVWFDSGAKLEMDISNDIFGRLKESDKKNGTTYESEARDYFMKFEHDEFVEMGGTPDVSFELPKGYRKASFTSSRQ
ncbi:hypothetical protein H0H87_009987, partial [Tephrocybe sp. NHM501043]